MTQTKSIKSLDLETKPKTPKRVKTLSASVQKKIKKLRLLDATGREAAWKAAYLACDLVENDGIQQKQIAEELGKAKGTVSTYIKAAWVGQAVGASGFHEFEEKVGVDFAARTYREWKNLGTKDADLIGLVHFARERLEARSEKEVRRKLTSQLIQSRKATLAKKTSRTLKIKELKDRCYHGSCIDWLKSAKANSIKIIHADPPYGDYTHKKDGKLYADQSAVAGLRTDCDNEDSTAAIKVTCAMIKASTRVLARDDGHGGGVLLLWQAAGMPIRKPIMEAIEKAKLEVKWELLVHTGTPKPGDARSPHARNAEKLLVIQRPKDNLLRCDAGDELSHTGCVVMFDDIKQYAQSWQSANNRTFWSFAEGSPMLPTVPKEFRHRKIRKDSKIENGDGHFMMKHEETSLFLLGKYALPCERVVDLFGCSASFSAAAQQYGADWTYVESNDANFNFGLERLRKLRMQQSTTDIDK